MPTYPYFRSAIRSLREKRGWTQEQLAEKAGLDYKYYQLIETGQRTAPALKTVEKLAKALGVKPWVLLCDEVELIAERANLKSELLSSLPSAKPGRPKSREKTGKSAPSKRI
jgi:XRE family transcriptional regulator, regulator of sulfur utilization